MPTRPQIIAIQKARRQLQLNDAQYRTLLKNVARVESSKDLDNAGVEDVMAVFEDMGFQQHPAGPTYWRDKVAARGNRANARMVQKIEMLAGQQRYCLPALCERFSGGRAQTPIDLTPAEAWKLIEMLKSAAAREATPRTSPKVKEDRHAQASLFN